MPQLDTDSLDLVNCLEYFEKMNQLCKVCGEPAAGFHFGAFTCEGCKSFFGRTYNNISAISGCKNNGDCVINKKNRTACKACRLRKCLLVGMSKSGSRYGRRSNWFKIHCLLQEQQTQQQIVNHQHQTLSANYEQFSHIHQQIQSQQAYQDKTHQQQKTANLQSPVSTPNPFLGLPLHNGNNGQMKSNPRTSSPSDSGASSADPEDTSSNKDSVLDSSVDERLRKVATSENIRSSSEPLKGFPPFSTKLSQFSPVSMISIPPLAPGSFSGCISVQEEPIDLSVKSRKRCRTTSPPPTAIDLPKPAPLDLTLVRSQPMSG